METVEKLIASLEQYGRLSKEDKELIHNHSEVQSYGQNEIFIKVGTIAHQVGFVLSGVFRYFFYDNEGNEITSVFMKEGDFVTNITSFNEYTPSSGTIMAETPCEVVLISRKNWKLFTEKISSWNKIIQAITNQVLLEKAQFQRQLINQDAKTSYLEFVKKYPTITQRVPLIHIASFLGITKFSLSRIRKQIAKE